MVKKSKIVYIPGPVYLVCGEIRKWGHADIPSVLRAAAVYAEKIPKNNNSKKSYDHSHLEKIIKYLEKGLNISIQNVHVKPKPEEKNIFGDYDPNYDSNIDWVSDLGYSGMEG